MKTYELEFAEDALKEWRKLGSTLREQFRKKLAQRLTNPHVPSARLRELPDCYKIKLRSAGYRLVYQAQDDRLIVFVIAVGKCERNLVYKIAAGRLN